MGKHTDSYADETSHSQQNRVDDFQTFNSSATDDVSISHPGEGREAIELRKPLLVAMARQNVSESAFEDSNIDTIFDEALCDVTELALKDAEFGVEDSEVELFKLQALLIHIARDFDSFRKLADYVSQYSAGESTRFDLPVRGASTYQKAAKQLKENNTFGTLEDACFIAVHALFWNGVPIPDTVEKRYSLSDELGPEASDFSPASRQLALYNLVEDLLELVVQNLTLDRASNKSRPLRPLVGAFAYAARHGETIEYYKQTARHSFDLRDAASGSTFRGHINDLKVVDIADMFGEIHEELLQYVIESGVLSEPVIVSYDLTDIQNLGMNEFNPRFLTEDGRWRFASLSITDSSLEFCFGLRLLKSEAARADKLKTFLRKLKQMVDVKRFIADRGFDGHKDIKACIKYAEGKWVICAQDDSKQSGDTSDYAQLRAALEPGGTAVKPTSDFKNINHPIKLIAYSGATKDADSPSPIRAFYTDISIEDQEEDQDKLITDINFQYNSRGKIESMFRMAKNTFDVATDSDKASRRSFYFHMSTLFYNLYKIVNTVPSPKHGLTLEVSQREFLEVLHNLALDGPKPPNALTFHKEHY
jgi:hypothetical protein